MTTTATRLFTPDEASERLPFHAKTLVRFAREGRIGHVRLGQRRGRMHTGTARSSRVGRVT